MKMESLFSIFFTSRKLIVSIAAVSRNKKVLLKNFTQLSALEE